MAKERRGEDDRQKDREIWKRGKKNEKEREMEEVREKPNRVVLGWELIIVFIDSFLR